MRVRPFLPWVTGLLVAASLSLPGCGTKEESDDPEFDADWVEEFESDSAEDAAEEAEQAQLDQLDDLDDVEVLEATNEPALQTNALSKKGAPKRAPHGPISIIQDDTYLTNGDRMAEAKALGADVLRVMVQWAEVAPAKREKGFVASRPDDYDWRKLDAQIEAARDNGLKVLLTLTAGNMPAWASEDPSKCAGKTVCSWRPSPKEYAKFVTAVGRHIKHRGYKIWGWTFVHEPNVGTSIADKDGPHDKDSTSAMEVAFRYRRLFFAARKHLRATAKVRARAFFSDIAANQATPGETLSPSSPRWNLLPWSLCLQTEWNPELLDDKYKCPERPRKVHVQGIAFHPYGSSASSALYSVEFLQKLIDDLAETGRIGRNRGLYMTEAGFLTAKIDDDRGLGSAGAVTPEQQALYLNELEHMLAANRRVKSLAQVQLVDEGQGVWDAGLRFAHGRVARTDGGVVEGDLVEVVRGSHVVVGGTRVEWSEIAKIERTGAGAEKPAYAAYRSAVHAEKNGDQVTVWGHPRAGDGTGFSIEGLFASGEWHELTTVPSDELGFGEKTIPIAGALAWRVRFGGDVSRVTNGEESPGEEFEPPDGEDPGDVDGPTAEIKAGCTAKANLAGFPVWMHFTRPDEPCAGTPGKDRHALRELVRLIKKVPVGARIDAHIFNISVDSVAKALYDAQEKGVDVWISTDKQIAKSKDPGVVNYLDKLRNKTYCNADNNRACIGTADRAISHTKLFVFSQTEMPDGTPSNEVVWLGSANQTYHSGMKLYNNTVTVYGDGVLYGKARAYLDDLYRQRRTSDYYDSASGRGYLLAPAADVYVSPEAESDLIVSRLNDVTPDENCRVSVLQMEVLDSRMDVVDQLVKMKQGKCRVQVATGKLGRKARAAFRAAGIPVHDKPIHDKVFVVYGKYADGYAYRVHTGSHNLSSFANRKSDEIFVRLAAEKGDTHPVYDAFLTHFEDAFKDGTPF